MTADRSTDAPESLRPEFDAEKLLESLNYWVSHSVDPDSAMVCLLSECDASALQWILADWMRISVVSERAPSRDDVLEEAAKICDSIADEWAARVAEGSEQDGYEQDVLRAAALAIRALQQPTNAGEIPAPNAAPQGQGGESREAPLNAGSTPAAAAPSAADTNRAAELIDAVREFHSARRELAWNCYAMVAQANELSAALKRFDERNGG